MTCQHTMTLGVYLLGALEPSERFAFESHLSYCEICRGELVRLAPLPGLLNQIAPEDFADDMPPTGVEDMGGAVITRPPRIIDPAQIPVQQPLPRQPVEPPVNRPRNKNDKRDKRVRKGTRFGRATSAAVAAVILAVGAIFGWQTLRHDEATVPPAAAGVVWSGTSSDGKVKIQARMIDHEWGTEIQSKVHGLPPGRGCYVVVFDHYAYKETGGWWGTDHDPNEEIPGSTSIMRSKIDRLVYMLDDRETIILTIEAPR